MCNKGLIEAVGGKLFNCLLFSLVYLVIYQPTPLRSHAFVAMQLIILGMLSVGLGELVCATKV